MHQSPNDRAVPLVHRARPARVGHLDVSGKQLRQRRYGR
jgi:hypothetical protein